MSTGLGNAGLLVGVAVLVVVVAVLIFGRRGRQRDDWAGSRPEDRPRPEPTGRAPYGADAPGYPSAPPPPSTPSMSEGVEPPPVDNDETTLPTADPEPERPRRIDDTSRFREQHRPDVPPSE